MVQHGNMNDQRRKIGRANEGGDQGGNHVGGDRSRDGSEGCADDDGYSQIDDIAAKNEVTKSLKLF